MNLREVKIFNPIFFNQPKLSLSLALAAWLIVLWNVVLNNDSLVIFIISITIYQSLFFLIVLKCKFRWEKKRVERTKSTLLEQPILQKNSIQSKLNQQFSFYNNSMLNAIWFALIQDNFVYVYVLETFHIFLLITNRLNVLFLFCNFFHSNLFRIQTVFIIAVITVL